MTEAMPFLQKYDITFLRPPTIRWGFPFRILDVSLRIVLALAFRVRPL